MMNLDLWLACFTVPRYCQNLTRGQFAQSPENGSNIYEHVHKDFEYQTGADLLNGPGT